jgi:hypothetical protein
MSTKHKILDVKQTKFILSKDSLVNVKVKNTKAVVHPQT